MNALRQITLSIEEALYLRLEARASAMNMPTSKYARLIFDAAYAARIGQEKELPISDRDLDETVKLVFACAGHGSSAMTAKTIGISESLVERITEGWRSALKNKLPTKPAAPAPVRSRRNSYSPDEIEMVRKLWAEGVTARDIAARIGRSQGAFEMWASKHRDVCPSRRKAKS